MNEILKNANTKCINAALVGDMVEEKPVGMLV
jgi:hypothetical protein